MKGKRTDELRVGMTASFSKTISEHDVYAFAGITGDFNPVHIDAEAAAKSMFGARVAHGVICAGLISTVFGMKLPGPGAVYLSQSLRFRKPVFLGDTVTAEVEVAEIDAVKNRVRFSTRCVKQDGSVVAEGESTLMPPVE
ncbi:MaoC family dehydratase [bacterium]|nr:MaoC family dehydratase [bacterium]